MQCKYFPIYQCVCKSNAEYLSNRVLKNTGKKYHNISCLPFYTFQDKNSCIWFIVMFRRCVAHVYLYVIHSYVTFHRSNVMHSCPMSAFYPPSFCMRIQLLSLSSTFSILVFYVQYLCLNFFFSVSITSCHPTQFIDVASVFISPRFTYTYSKFGRR